MSEFCPPLQLRPQGETIINPDGLLLVRSTLEITALMKRLHPAFESVLNDIEAEVQRAAQSLVDAGSTSRAHTALETVHRVRLKLVQLDFSQNRFVA